jgi:hypothetical protein
MKCRTWLAVTGVLAVLCAPGEVDAQQGRSIFSALDTQGRTVAVGEELQGSLSDGDVLSAGGRRVQVWTLGAEQGQEVQIDLRSDDFDAFLYVVGPGLNEGLRDDDGGSGLNSRICFVPDEPGEYRLVASSLNAGTGGFSLSAVPTEGACGGASTTNEVDDLANLPTEGRVLRVGDDVSGALTDTDPSFYGSAVQAWAVQGVAGSSFSVDLVSSDFDSFLTVIGPGLEEWLDDDDGAGRCDSRVSLTFSETGEYRVVVSTLGGGTGAFSLVASELPGPVNPESCVPPFEEGEGEYEYLEGNLDDVFTVGSLSMETAVTGVMAGDEVHFRSRPVQGWSLEGMGGTRVAVTLTSDQFDTYLFFDGPGFDEPLSDDDSAGDLDSRICVELPETGAYRVFAGPLSSADDGARYTLEASVVDAAELCGGVFEFSPERAAELLEGLDTEGRVIGLEEELEGTLSGDVRHPESGRPVQPWTLRAPPGTFLYVDVLASGFDGYLYVLGGGLDGVLTADDSEGTLNPRLSLTMPASGEVLLLPSSFDTSARGNFLLRVSTDPGSMESPDGGSATTGTMADASSVADVGPPVARLVFGGEISGTLRQTDGMTSGGGYAQAFTYDGTEGEEGVFELVAEDFDPFLYLVGPDLAWAVSDDDSAGNLDSRIEATLPEGGTYTVVASALREDVTGSFRLRVFRVIR